MKKILERWSIVKRMSIFIIVLGLCICTFPQLGDILNAEGALLASVQVEEDVKDTKRIEVTTQEYSYSTVLLMKDKKEVARSSIATSKPAVFYVQANGTYEVQIQNANKKVVETQTVEITDFPDLRIEADETEKNLKIIGRIAGGDHFIVSGNGVNQEVTTSLLSDNTYTGIFTPKENGVYTITIANNKNEQLGKAITYNVTFLNEQKTVSSSPVSAQPIHINNEAELKQIDKQPAGTYVLDREIVITDTSSKPLLKNTFTGVLHGNGFQIKDMKQPLFQSVKGAVIDGLSLQGAWKNESGAMLALESTSGKYDSIAINADIQSKNDIAGMMLTSNGDTIVKSYVSGSISGKNAAGFFLHGASVISDSYVSGLILAEEDAVGFAHQAEISNSLLVANVSGKSMTLFNDTAKKLEKSLYDVNLQEVEEPRAQSCTTKQMIDKELLVSEKFKTEQDNYPALIPTFAWSENAKKSEALSRIALPLTQNIHGTTKNIELPEKSGDVKLNWTSNGRTAVSNNQIVAKVTKNQKQDTSSIITLRSASGVMAYRAASASQLENSPVAGKSLAETTTTISFNATEKQYYIIKEKNDVPENPTSHINALENGWKRYLWSGIINWSDLKWNTDYVLYEYDLTKKELHTYPLKTNQGLIGGDVVLSDLNAVGTPITATLSDTALIDQGSWTWEKSKSITSGWTTISGRDHVDVNAKTSAYTPTDEDAGFYIRATFTVADGLDYKGSVSQISNTMVRQLLTSISILNQDDDPISSNDMVVGKLFRASLAQAKFANDVNYFWYHVGDPAIQGSGKEYMLSGKDVGTNVYVKAVAKSDGGAAGSIESSPSDPIKKAVTAAPSVKPQLVDGSITDVSVTVKMPDSIHEGLYEFGYIKSGTGDDPTPFSTYARANNQLTITGLSPNTTYYITVRQIGENGYEDSKWANESDGSLELEVKTQNEHIKGTAVITGSPIYGQTLQSSIVNGNSKQTSDVVWYRISGDTETQIGTGADYTISQAKDIGAKLKVVYSGTGKFAGQISVETDTIKKAEVIAPLNALSTDTSAAISDTQLMLQLPTADKATGLSLTEKFIVGYSLTEGGVPVEYRDEDGKVVTFDPSDSTNHPGTNTVTLNNFRRNTEYYIFLRYAETATHYKSEWSSIGNCISLTTQKTAFTGSLSFAYASIDKPIQGEKLKAECSSANTLDGTWKWTRINADGSETEIKNFFPDGESATYIVIPDNDEIIGARYKVSFVPNVDYSGSTTATSEPVQKFKKEKHKTPGAIPAKVSQSDTSMTFSMDAGLEGAVYQFKYSKGIDPAAAIPVDVKAYKGTNVTITGLDRNTEYHIWVSRVGDSLKEDSDYTSSPLSITTDRSDLLGYVAIDDVPEVDKPLTARYVTAKYIPSGDDSHGTWQWYRKNDTKFELIAGADAATYTPTTSDIGKVLRAVYTGTGDFQDEKSAVSEKVRKPIVSDPVISSFETIADIDNHLALKGEFPSGVWYRLQKDSVDIPELPAGYKDADFTGAGWTKATSSTTTFTKDFNKDWLVPNTTYVLYIVKAETDTSQASNIVSSTKTLGILTQTGSVVLSGDPVVTKDLKATLTNGNNSNGTWIWYRSNSTAGDGSTPAPAISDSSKWTKIASGYAPSVNADSSVLTLSNDLFSFYIKAEFVADESLSYKGTIKSNASASIKKIYEESLSLSSSTMDGNGDPKAYSGSSVTATIDNYVGTTKVTENTSTTGRKDPQFLIGSKVFTPTTATVDAVNHKATFSYVMPNDSTLDGLTLSAAVYVPNNYKLYVDKEMKPIAWEKLKTTAATNFNYSYGIPISNANDLNAFMQSTGKYTDRTASYVITNNINLKSSGAVTPTKFDGNLNGDFHTIVNSKNALILSGTGSTVRNMILLNGQVSVGAGLYGSLLYQAASKDITINKVFLVQSKVLAGFDTSYFGSFTGYSRISECGAVSGVVATTNTSGNSSGGFIAALVHDGKAYDNFSLDVQVQHPGVYSSTGALFGTVQTRADAYRNFSATKTGSYPVNGGVVGSVSSTGVVENNFYDKTLAPEDYLGNPVSKGIGKTTQEMVGTGLQSSFSGAPNGTWVYTDGYYPRLTWLKDHPISALYAATRGAFTSVDGKTTTTQLFNGTLNGVAKVPQDLQKSSYTYTSSNQNIIQVTSGGTIVPVGTKGQSATVTITYTEPDASIGGTASQTYTFTVGTKAAAVTSPAISGTPNIGQTLTGTTSGATSYQWYRRKSGSTARTKVSGATSATYTLKPDDIGYEFCVDVTSSAGTSSSRFTTAAGSTAPTGITTKDIKDGSVKVQAQGVSGATYEYAYATTSGGTKNSAGTTNSEFTISGLDRDSDYWLYARVAGASDGSYQAGLWSSAVKITTAKTDIEGVPILNGNINMKTSLSASMPDTNMQTGDWKLERIDAATGNPTATLSPTNKTAYGMNYTLTADDVGSKIRVSYIANGHFKDASGGIAKSETKVILKQAQTPPTGPSNLDAEKSDHSLVVKETDTEAGTTYQFGYRKNIKDAITIVSGTYNSDQKVTISGLARNTSYYVYARKAEKADYEPSPWSPSAQITTDKTSVDQSVIQTNGTFQVDQTVTFNLKANGDNDKDSTGLWVLERIKDGETNTLLGTASADTHTLTYTIVPQDSGYQLKASYIANGDYKDSQTTTSAVVSNNTQTIGSIMPTINTDKIDVYAVDVKVDAPSNDIYEFGYRKAGTADAISIHPVTATWGNDVAIQPLERDTEYEIYVRKAARVGYDASGWSSAVSVQTLKEQLSGNIMYTGSTAVKDTLTAIYEKGVYDYAGDDTKGTWQWYIDGAAVEGATSASFTIEPTEGTPTVSVIYTAEADSGFEGTLERSFGKIYKADYAVPQAAKITAEGEDNAQEGSILKVTNAETDHVYIYLQDSGNDELPPLELAPNITEGLHTDDMDNINRWIKAEPSMEIRVPANRTYIVYSARLEDNTNSASEISSTRGVLSAKEPLLRDASTGITIEEADPGVAWKAMQKKTLQYSLYGKAPTATWHYFVQAPGETIWQNIDLELFNMTGDEKRVDESKDGVLSSTITIPMKYKTYLVKAVLSGTDDYSGSVEYITPAIEGRMIDTGGASITKADTTRLLDVLQATYSGGDDENGTFVWYHVKDGITKKLFKDSPNVVSTYTLKESDLNTYVYAEYEAAPGSLYSGKARTDQVFVKAKALQNKPDAVTISQVNGNSVQVVAPDNYKRDNMDTTPQAVMGYQETDEHGTPKAGSAITWQIGDSIGDNWFKKLHKNSYYVFYARYEGTGVYAPSDDSVASAVVLTENETFNEDHLTLKTQKSDPDASAEEKKRAVVGDELVATFTGEGYDEGYFELLRSNGQTIIAKADAVSDADAKSITFRYTYTSDDVGSTLVVRYHALDDAVYYDGYVEKSTNQKVHKKPADGTAVEPKLERGLDTDLLVELKPGYEYYLSKSSTAPAVDSPKWDVLEENMDAKPGYHDFLNLERTTEYYLHARIAETASNEAGEGVTSNKLSPHPFIDLGDMTIKNALDDNAAKAEGGKIDFPYTLTKGTMKITSVSMVRESDKAAVQLSSDITPFTDGTKGARNVFEAGSDWANENFGYTLNLYKADGTLLDTSSGKETLQLASADAAVMQLTMYRANAVTKGGTFTVQFKVEDAEGNEALLQSSVTIATDIKATVPIKIDLNLIDKKQIKQDSNTHKLDNQSGMPMEVQVDKLAEAGSGMPDLAGIYQAGSVLGKGKAYLKISNDNSNYTSRWNGVFFDSTLPASKLIPFVKLGDQAKTDYYVSGIASEDEDWPWADKTASVKTIPEAYRFRFVYRISKEKAGLQSKEKYVFKEE